MRLAPSPLLSFGVLFFGLLLLLACGGGGSAVAPAGISLSAPASAVVEGFTLPVTATSADPKNATLVWSTDDLRVATVDQHGVVVGCAPGTATVSARAPATGARATIEINVEPDTGFNTLLPIDDANLAPTIERTSTVGRCEVTLHHTGIAATVVKGRFRRYHRLLLPRTGILGDVGKPELPFHLLSFAIPVDPVTQARATWRVEVERTSPIPYTGIRPWPHQPPTWMDGNPDEPDVIPPFVVDDAAYETQEAQPALVHAAEAVEFGNLPILEVSVSPCRYLPATSTLELFESTRVIVTFEGAAPLAMPRPLGDYKGIQEPGVDELIADQVQNWDLLTLVDAGDLVLPLPPIDDTTVRDMPFDLLIVTRPALASAARRLARWRQDHGTRVRLEVLAAADYPDADSIRDRIRALDDANRVVIAGSWHPRAMRALLIFGDVEHIPTFRGLNQRNRDLPDVLDQEMVPIAGTDLPYSTLRGPDDQVDVALGRISVDDVPEGHAVLDKIEAYEGLPADQYPHRAAIYGFFEDRPEGWGTVDGRFEFRPGADFLFGAATDYDLTTIIGEMIRPNEGDPVDEERYRVRLASVDAAHDFLGLYQVWPASLGWVRSVVGLQVASHDGQEDLRCVLGAERIRAFMGSLGVPVISGYTRTEHPAPVPTPLRTYDGRTLHTDFLGYGWGITATKIAEKWQEGLDGFVLHLGHGWPEQWKDPRFPPSALSAAGPIAGPWCPIVFSINCSSGYFDSETDWVWQWKSPLAVEVENTSVVNEWSQHEESFCEEVLRMPDAGGVALIGASRGSTSRYTDKLIDGLFGAMYAQYESGLFASGPHARRPLTYLGDIVRMGKRVMYDWVRSPRGANKPDSATYCLQTFHLFGDPMLRVRMPRQAVDD